MEFIYTVWFRDLSVFEDDPDYEWPACFIIRGNSERDCKKWGDHLAEKHVKATNNIFLKSTIESKDKSMLTGMESLPIIIEFEEASDSKIGW